jgi:hypothetical protein
MNEHQDYDQIPAIRWSHLKLLLDGAPLHFRYAEDHPEEGDTASRVQLRAIHARILEPEKFNATHAVYDGIRRGNVFDTFRADHPGCTILNQREWLETSGIARAVFCHPVAGPIVMHEDGKHEVTLTWEEKGLKCKGRADILIEYPDHVEVWDLKTVGSANRDEIRRMIRRLHWDGQGAHYSAGAFETFKKRVTFGLIVVEKDAPHDVGVYRLTSEDLDRADDQRLILLDILSECYEDNRWPGRCFGVEELPLDDTTMITVSDDDGEEMP